MANRISQWLKSLGSRKGSICNKSRSCILVLAGMPLADAARHIGFKGTFVARQKRGGSVQGFQAVQNWMETTPREKRKLYILGAYHKSFLVYNF